MRAYRTKKLKPIELKQEIKNYENLSFAFKEMFNRSKIMRVRLKELGNATRMVLVQVLP